MANANVVPHSSPNVNSATSVVDLDPTGETFESSLRQSPQHGKQTKVDGLSSVTQYYEGKGLSKHVTNVLLDS